MPSLLDFDFHSLWRGFQSAAFFYLSCAPCTARSASRARRKQIARERSERDALELVQPSVYRQPSPYRTNAYWAEEIRLGPGPPARRINEKQKAARAKALSRPVESTLELVAADGGKWPARSGGPPVAENERWKLNQREDESLWGNAAYPGSKGVSGAGNDHGVSSEKFPSLQDFTVGQSLKTGHDTPRNPPVNDLHPPIVSNPAFSSGSNMWMLQPPPPATIMKGYESPSNSRSRSTTASSESPSSRRGGGSTASNSILGRKLSQRLVEEKLRRGEMLYPNDLRRVSSTMSANTEALRIEAKYFEDPVASKRQQHQLPDPSTESIPQDKALAKANANANANANESFEKADSGVEMKQLPGSKENADISTHRQDFAFSNRQGKQIIAVPFASLPPSVLSNETFSSANRNDIRVIRRKPIRNQRHRTSTLPRTQNGPTSKRPRLSKLLSDPGESGQDQSSNTASRPRASVDSDADDEGEGDENEEEDEDEDDRGGDKSNIPIPGSAEISKNEILTLFDRRSQSRHALQVSHHNARWERRRSVDF